MRLVYNENPFKTTIILNSLEAKRLKSKLRSISSIESCAPKFKCVRQSHQGACNGYPTIECKRCIIEKLLGINTIEGLSRSSGYWVRQAFANFNESAFLCEISYLQKVAAINGSRWQEINAAIRWIRNVHMPRYAYTKFCTFNIIPLDFSDKETYTAWVKNWKVEYEQISQRIRQRKQIIADLGNSNESTKLDNRMLFTLREIAHEMIDERLASKKETAKQLLKKNQKR